MNIDHFATRLLQEAGFDVDKVLNDGMGTGYVWWRPSVRDGVVMRIVPSCGLTRAKCEALLAAHFRRVAHRV